MVVWFLMLQEEGSALKFYVVASIMNMGSSDKNGHKDKY